MSAAHELVADQADVDGLLRHERSSSASVRSLLSSETGPAPTARTRSAPAASPTGVSVAVRDAFASGERGMSRCGDQRVEGVGTVMCVARQPPLVVISRDSRNSRRGALLGTGTALNFFGSGLDLGFASRLPAMGSSSIREKKPQRRQGAKENAKEARNQGAICALSTRLRPSLSSATLKLMRSPSRLWVAWR